MRKFTITAIALLLILIATSASALTIDLPTEPVAVGQLVQLTVEGVDPDVLPATKAFCWPEVGTTFIPAKLWDNQPIIFFQAKLPGKYLIYVNTPIPGTDTTEDIKVVLTVTGEGPGPNPPVPPVPPVPGELSVVIISESLTRSPTQILTLTALREHVETKTYFYQSVDPDRIDGKTRKTPEWLATCLAAVNTRPVKLPVIVIGSGDPLSPHFSVVAVEPLPSTGAEAVAILTKYGG